MMSSLLTFVDLFQKSLFPAVLVLLILAWWGRGCRRNRVTGLLLTMLASILLFRFMLLFAKVPMSHRYFYLLVIILLIFAVPGFDVAVKLFRQLLVFLPGVGTKAAGRSGILLLVILSGICVGKALNPDFGKRWLDRLPEKLRQDAGSDAAIYLLTDILDSRLAYYADAEHLRFCREREMVLIPEENGKHRKYACRGGELAVQGKGIITGGWILRARPGDWRELGEELRSLPGNVYLVLRASDADLDEFLPGREQNFPFRFLFSYPDHKNNDLRVYRLELE